MAKQRHLTMAEQIVMEFLVRNIGEEYTSAEIETETGIQSFMIPAIMNNLRWKGYNVASRKGKHFFIKNSWIGYLVAAVMIAFLMGALMFGWMKYSAGCPGCPPDDQPTKSAFVDPSIFVESSAKNAVGK